MTWKHVCSRDDIAVHGLARFDVDGVPVVIANLGEHGFSAFPPSCPHMEEPLDNSGMCAGTVLTCSKHLWQWDMLSGEAAGPADNQRTLLRYDVKVTENDVHVRIENELVYNYGDENDEDDDFEW